MGAGLASPAPDAVRSAEETNTPPDPSAITTGTTVPLPAAEEPPMPSAALPEEAAELAAEQELQSDSASVATGSGSVGPGILGRIKEKVAESETVKKGVGFVVEKSKAMGQKVAESERVQQSVEFVRKKTVELAESERLQKGIEYAKGTAKAVTEKTQQGLEFAKEKTRAVREGAGTAWEKGRGSIQRARAEVGKIAWRGSARETLDMAAREEQWKGIKVQGAEEISVPPRTEHTSSFHVSRGSTLRWTFRVKDYDIGFGVRMRVQEWGGSKEEEVLAVEKYDSADTVSGSWVADENRTIVLSFDNRYSRLRSKTVAYIVGTEKPPIFTEPQSEAASASSPSTTAALPPAVKPMV